MEYLRLFKNRKEYVDAKSGSTLPIYSHCINEAEIHYNSSEEKGFKWKATYADGHIESAECDSTSAITYREIAFNDSNLRKIEIGNCVTKIDDYAFENYQTVSSVTIPNSVTKIGDNAFAWWFSLSSLTIPNSVTSIGQSAFLGCNSLTSVFISSNVTDISSKQNPFGWCNSITSITIDEGNTTYDCRNNCDAIIETRTNKLISGCKNTVIPNSVTSIGGWAFCGCDFTEFNIPNSITRIGEYGFDSCRNLTNITVPNSLANLEKGSFGYCDSLTSVTIGSGVTSIGDYAFQNCINISSFIINAIIPPTLGYGVFGNTQGLFVNFPIYVHSESVEAYKTAEKWSDYADRIQPIH
jgi:hypothetical protein